MSVLALLFSLLMLVLVFWYGVAGANAFPLPSQAIGGVGLVGILFAGYALYQKRKSETDT